jgi:hypothetical protein
MKPTKFKGSQQAFDAGFLLPLPSTHKNLSESKAADPPESGGTAAFYNSFQ